MSIVQSIKEKILKLAIPKGYACLPVLIQVNGVSGRVQEAGYLFQNN